MVSAEVDAAADAEGVLAWFDVPSNTLAIGMCMSIMGAFTGNAVGNFVDATFDNSAGVVALGTLVCNALFAVLGISLGCLLGMFPLCFYNEDDAR